MTAEDLYHETILALDAEPRHEGRLEEATHTARTSNPLCGDRVQIDLRVEEGVVREAWFVGRGCAISRASASLLTELVEGCSIEEACALEARLEAWLTEGGATPEGLASLEALAGVRAFPSRIKCATLAWTSLRKALR